MRRRISARELTGGRVMALGAPSFSTPTLHRTPTCLLGSLEGGKVAPQTDDLEEVCLTLRGEGSRHGSNRWSWWMNP